MENVVYPGSFHLKNGTDNQPQVQIGEF